MIKVIFTILLSCFLFSCKQQNQNTTFDNIEIVKENIPTCDPKPIKTIKKEGISLKIYDFHNLEPLFNKNCEDIHVINFWATWCKPCVKELPYFERLHSEQNIPVTLISLDMPNLIESKLIPFIKKENLQSNVIVLDDPDANAWIPKISEDWSGAIPATIIIKGKQKKFYEQSFTYETLTEAIKTL